jgi:hypothetical protein
VKDNLAQAFADEAGVDKSRVTVVVYAGSTIIEVTIVAESQEAAANTTTTLGATFNTLSATTNFLDTVELPAGVTITATVTPAVATVSKSIAVVPPSPPPSYDHDEMDGGAIAGIVIGSLIGAALIGGAIYLGLNQAAKRAPTSEPGVAFSSDLKQTNQQEFDNI